MRIVVYGLGIIGGSVAASLKRAGHAVYGMNRSRAPMEYALSHRMIDGEVNDFSGAEVVILALPPRIAMRVLDEGKFPAGCIVADICGVKEPVERVVYSKARSWRYVGTHPMAGKETSGITSASETLFCGANFVLTRCAQTDEDALCTVRALAREMGCSRIVECSAREHDEMIALTSQLAHVVSNAYVASPHAAACAGFTGGSFQDMTRVAPVDEDVWAELFALNADALGQEIDRLQARLGAFRKALSCGDEEELRRLMREGKACYREFFRSK